MTDAAAGPTTTVDPPPSRRRRLRLFPRFGLRTLFVVAVVFCLLCGWIGRNVYRMRQEDAAIERIKQIGGRLSIRSGDGWTAHPATPYQQGPGSPTVAQSLVRRTAYVLSLDRPPEVIGVETGRIDNEAEGDAALQTLATFRDLESVELSGAGFTDRSIERLPRAPKLKALGLHSTMVTAAGLAKIPSPERIESLSAIGDDRTPDLIEGVASLPELRSVQIGGTPLSKEELSGLGRHPRLEDVSLFYWTHTGDVELSPLAESRTLRRLRLIGPTTTVLDIASIAKIGGIERLTLRCLNLSDEDLETLRSLRFLRSLTIGPLVTSDGARRFSAALRGCSVRLLGPQDELFLAGESVDATGPEQPPQQP